MNDDWPYIRGVGRIPMSYNNMAVFRSEIAASVAYDRNFDDGRHDRLSGLPCRSANGAYLDGWYSIPNPRSKI